MNVDARSQYISLFSGAGGLELALQLALPDARCVCYVEREVEACEILAARIVDKALDDAPVWSDVSTFDGRPWRGLVDGIVGGFPCQDLSVAGKRAGIQRGNRSGLFYEYVRIIREVQPRWVFIENVRAVLALPAGGIVLGELAELGFDAEWGSLEAGDVGASHQRHRKFILAYRRCERDERRGIVRDVLAAARSSQRGEEKRQRIRPDSGNGYTDLELAESDGRRKGWAKSAWQQGRSDASVAGSELAIAGGVGRSAGVSGSFARDERNAGVSEHHRHAMVFAPGPEDAIWGDVLVRDYGMRPALSQAEAESCLRRVADGLASPLDQRIDRLRACGNGVVAIQGAAAFRELVRRAVEQHPL